jgi:hypothetical protein
MKKLKSMSVDLATISSRISSLEAGHQVSLPTPCEEVSDLISMAPGSQEATFLSEDERSPEGILTERNWLRPVSKGVNTLRARIRLGGYSPWWTSPSLHRKYFQPVYSV